MANLADEIQKLRLAAALFRCGDDGQWRHLYAIDQPGERTPQRHRHRGIACADDVSLQGGEQLSQQRRAVHRFRPRFNRGKNCCLTAFVHCGVSSFADFLVEHANAHAQALGFRVAQLLVFEAVKQRQALNNVLNHLACRQCVQCCLAAFY